MLADKVCNNYPRNECNMKRDIRNVAFSASTAEIRRTIHKTKLYGVRNRPPPKNHRSN